MTFLQNRNRSLGTMVCGTHRNWNGRPWGMTDEFSSRALHNSCEALDKILARLVDMHLTDGRGLDLHSEPLDVSKHLPQTHGGPRSWQHNPSSTESLGWMSRFSGSKHIPTDVCTLKYLWIKSSLPSDLIYSLRKSWRCLHQVVRVHLITALDLAQLLPYYPSTSFFFFYEFSSSSRASCLNLVARESLLLVERASSMFGEHW